MTFVRYEISDACMVLEAKGHAGHGKMGGDIVCAAISTIICSLAEYVDRQVNPHNIDMEDGDVYISLDRPDATCKEVFEFCIEALIRLSEVYPANITIG